VEWTLPTAVRADRESETIKKVCETGELGELEYVPSSERSPEVQLIRLRRRRDGDRETFGRQWNKRIRFYYQFLNHQ